MKNTIAHTILDQLGRSTLAMLGAKDLMTNGDDLCFTIQGCKTINFIQIVLTPADLYDLKFYKKRLKLKRGESVGNYCRLISEVTEIFCNQLHDTIERKTGLYTTVHPRR